MEKENYLLTPLISKSAETVEDKNNTIYKVYVIYGINMLIIFNTVMSSL